MQPKNKPVINFMDDNLFNSFLFARGEVIFEYSCFSEFHFNCRGNTQKSYKIVYYELNPICPICGQPLNKMGCRSLF